MIAISPAASSRPFSRGQDQKENPAEARGKSQVWRMSGRPGEIGGGGAVQPAFRDGTYGKPRPYVCDGHHKECDFGSGHLIEHGEGGPCRGCIFI
jgi:hypothetical protein